MTFFVHVGPVAIREGRYWRGYMSGNRACAKLRRTPERAIRDAVQASEAGESRER